mmetsp:Transcript_14851/g.44864  ORF Transcript_14851/g.44864 Transcript_14851/m.44864 type:complete len:393 (-) Transcript_14851:1597-2775(-)
METGSKTAGSVTGSADRLVRNAAQVGVRALSNDGLPADSCPLTALLAPKLGSCQIHNKHGVRQVGQRGTLSDGVLPGRQKLPHEPHVVRLQRPPLLHDVVAQLAGGTVGGSVVGGGPHREVVQRAHRLVALPRQLLLRRPEVPPHPDNRLQLVFGEFDVPQHAALTVLDAVIAGAAHAAGIVAAAGGTAALRRTALAISIGLLVRVRVLAVTTGGAVHDVAGGGRGGQGVQGLQGLHAGEPQLPDLLRRARQLEGDELDEGQVEGHEVLVGGAAQLLHVRLQQQPPVLVGPLIVGVPLAGVKDAVHGGHDEARRVRLLAPAIRIVPRHACRLPCDLLQLPVHWYLEARGREVILAQLERRGKLLGRTREQRNELPRTRARIRIAVQTLPHEI